MNTSPAPSIYDIKTDPRNASILISVNGELFPREKAVVSVFDSGFIMGDGVWEGLRLINGGGVRNPLSTDDWAGAGPITRKLSAGYKKLATKQAARSI